MGVGGDKLQPVPALPGRREPSQPNTCADAAPGPAGPGVPPLRLPPAVPRDPRRRSARLASRTWGAAPSSHETRAGTVRARVVQRAVTLWRRPPLPRAHGVLAAGTRRLGIGRECRPAFVPTPRRSGGRKFGSRAEWPGGNRRCFSRREVFVIKYSLGPEGQDDQRFLDLHTHYLEGEEKCISFWLQISLS